MKEFILASNSPRRKELLLNSGYDFTVKPSDCSEETEDSLTPQQTVMELSERKALSVLSGNINAVVLCCDTVVALDGKILGKPHNREDAFSMIKMLSGKKHIVSSGVCIADKDRKITFENTVI